MNDHDSSAEADALLEAKRQVALGATERLLAVCGDQEPRLWLSRYHDIQEALRQGRLRDAIATANRVECTPGVEYGSPVWVVSEKLARDVWNAMCRVRMHIYYGDECDAVNFPVRPADVTLRGTIKRRDERAKKRSEGRFRIIVDPIESDPQFASILKVVNKKVDEKLIAEGIERFLGICHFIWAEKQRILRDEYGIEWKSPAELNPGVLFD